MFYKDQSIEESAALNSPYQDQEKGDYAQERSRCQDKERLQNSGEEKGQNQDKGWSQDHDVDQEEIAGLVAMYANECAPSCENITFLQDKVFPTLGPALCATVLEIRRERCVERSYSRLNALDFLSGQLYWRNPGHPDRPPDADIFTEMARRSLEARPRRPLPTCLVLSDATAATIVQKWYRGHLVRRSPEVSRLREYQARLRRLARKEGAPTGPAPVRRRSGRACR